jgi:hypothetical protein
LLTWTTGTIRECGMRNRNGTFREVSHCVLRIAYSAIPIRSPSNSGYHKHPRTVGKWGGKITDAKLHDRFLVDDVRVTDLVDQSPANRGPDSQQNGACTTPHRRRGDFANSGCQPNYEYEYEFDCQATNSQQPITTLSAAGPASLRPPAGPSHTLATRTGYDRSR